MSQLPNWVYDLVVDLIDHEDHPKLLYTSGGFEGAAKYDWCPCIALQKVPAAVVSHARVLHGYLRVAGQDKTDPDQGAMDNETSATEASG